jgi:transposase
LVLTTALGSDSDKLANIAAAPEVVREIAWKAQTRLTARYRALCRAGKLDVVAITTVARELAAFIWAIARAVGGKEMLTR